MMITKQYKNKTLTVIQVAEYSYWLKHQAADMIVQRWVTVYRSV